MNTIPPDHRPPPGAVDSVMRFCFARRKMMEQFVRLMNDGYYGRKELREEIADILREMRLKMDALR